MTYKCNYCFEEITNGFYIDDEFFGCCMEPECITYALVQHPENDNDDIEIEIDTENFFERIKN